MTRSKYDPDELHNTKVHLFAKDYHKSLKERGIKSALAGVKEQLHDSAHEWEPEINSKERSAYRLLKKKYGDGHNMAEHGEGKPYGSDK